MLAYYSDMHVFDYKFGLTEPDVAQLIAHRKDRFEDPNAPELTQIWNTVQPTYLLEDDRTLDAIAMHAGGTRANFAIHGLHYRVVKGFPIGETTDWLLAARRP